LISKLGLEVFKDGENEGDFVRGDRVFEVRGKTPAAGQPYAVQFKYKKYSTVRINRRKQRIFRGFPRDIFKF